MKVGSTMPCSPLRPLRTFSAKLFLSVEFYNSKRFKLPVSGICHGKSGRSSAILGLNNLITTELHTVYQSSQFISWDLNSRLSLAEKRNNGLSRMATNDWDSEALRVGFSNNLSNEGLSSDNIKGRNTEETLRVENSLGLEDLGGDWDGGIYGVGDDEDIGFWCNFCDSLNETFDDTGVDVEEIIAGHSWFAYISPLALALIYNPPHLVHTGNSSRNNNDICVFECGLGTIILWQVSGDFLYPSSAHILSIYPILVHTAGEEMCERSAATPGVFTTS